MKEVDCMGYKESTEFTITVRMQNRWIPHFLAVLKYMQRLGAIGSSRKVTLYSDGDGDFRPEFEWDENLPSEANPVKEDNGDRLYDAGYMMQVKEK